MADTFREYLSEANTPNKVKKGDKVQAFDTWESITWQILEAPKKDNSDPEISFKVLAKELNKRAMGANMKGYLGWNIKTKQWEVLNRFN